MLKKLKEKFSKKKVLIVGLGIAGGGAGIVNFFHKLGAKITLTDLKPKKELKDSLGKITRNVKLVLGKHRIRDFLETDYIIKGPSVPWSIKELKKAREKKIPILTDAQIFFDFAPREKIIGITGTKGKTRTCYLLRHFLKGRFKVLLTGMPDTSALFDLLGADKYDWIIWELSSFDLEQVRKSPHIAIITGIFPEHLNRYPSFAAYRDTKNNIIKFQKKNDIAILPYKSLFRKWAKEIPSKVIYFKEKKLRNLFSETSFFAAKKTANLLGISEKEILKSFKKFKELEHRLEFVGKYKGIIFINDSASTNPGATIFGLQKVSDFFNIPLSKIVLIAGGVDKRLDYGDLAKQLPKLKKTVLLPGSASEKIKRKAKKKNLIEVDSLSKAIKESISFVKRGDVVLFSPGAASFNLFRNEFDRGEKFKRIVKRLFI